MLSRPTLKRRAFLKTSLQASAALLIQLNLKVKADPALAHQSHLIPNGWLEIYPDNRFVFTLDKAEMGQNVITSLTAIIAEELDMDFDKLEVRFPTLSSTPANPKYKPSWGTGDSTSVRSLWLPLRHAGAATRALFNAAAATYWQTSGNQISHRNGVARLLGSNKTIPYAGLTDIAAKLKPPEYQLKKISDFKQLGKPLRRYDAKDKITGTTAYGIDKKVPGQKYAVLIRSPRLGAKPLSYKSLQVDTGKIEFVTISNGVAVIADSIWEAQRVSQQVKVNWQAGSTESSEELSQQLKRQLNTPGTLARDKGDAPKAIANAGKVLNASYRVPLLAHAPMEPMNCTAWLHDGICEVWAPTQRPPMARAAARKASGYPVDKVVLHTTLIGGGFGRRLQQDYVTEAVEIARQVAYPVQLIWSREEDMRYGVFRPAVCSELKATLTEQGKIDAWQHQIAALANKGNHPKKQRLSQRLIDAIRAAKNYMLGETIVRSGLIRGAADIPYASDNIHISFSSLKTGIPLGAWRSVGHSYNAFFVESFIDELAHYAGSDPVQFRLQHMQMENPRLAGTLATAAKLADWGATIKNGYSRGVACHACFGSYIAVIIKISVDNVLTNPQPVLERITCVADCGFVVDPDGVKAQLEGAILYGLSAAMYGKIDIQGGQVVQSNFHDYQTLRLNDCPQFDIHLINSDAPPGGVGELGTPCAAPALVNAWFAATGNRIRDLPLNSLR